jgi:hypothetical protein
VSGQLHASAALPPVKESSVPTRQEAGWDPETIWTHSRESNPGHPARSWSLCRLSYPDSYVAEVPGLISAASRFRTSILLSYPLCKAYMFAKHRLVSCKMIRVTEEGNDVMQKRRETESFERVLQRKFYGVLCVSLLP